MIWRELGRTPSCRRKVPSGRSFARSQTPRPFPSVAEASACPARVVDERDVGETIATTTNRVRSITMGNQDMRKARSRVDFGTGK